MKDFNVAEALQTVQITTSGPIVFVLVDTATGKVERVQPESAVPSSGVATPEVNLRVRTLGAIQIWAGDEDLAPLLLRQRVKGFIWLYLLAREIRRPGDHVTRTSLADELYPGIEPSIQRRRLRQQLSELHSSEFPSFLAACIRVNGEYIRLDASTCEIDARNVITLAQQFAHLAPLSMEGLQDVQIALAKAAEDFMPEWESIEQNATEGRGNASEVVNEVRRQLENSHMELLETLTSSGQDPSQFKRVIPYLHQGLLRFPTQEGIAWKLIEAYERIGQMREANRIRAKFGWSEAC